MIKANHYLTYEAYASTIEQKNEFVREFAQVLRRESLHADSDDEDILVPKGSTVVAHCKSPVCSPDLGRVCAGAVIWLAFECPIFMHEVRWDNLCVFESTSHNIKGFQWVHTDDGTRVRRVSVSPEQVIRVENPYEGQVLLPEFAYRASN